MAEGRSDVAIVVTRVPTAMGPDMVHIDATWPGGWAEYLVTLAGPGFHSPSELARKPGWSYTGYLPDGGYSLHVEGHAPAYFEVAPGVTGPATEENDG